MKRKLSALLLAALLALGTALCFAGCGSGNGSASTPSDPSTPSSPSSPSSPSDTDPDDKTEPETPAEPSTPEEPDEKQDETPENPEEPEENPDDTPTDPPAEKFSLAENREKIIENLMPIINYSAIRLMGTGTKVYEVYDISIEYQENSTIIEAVYSGLHFMKTSEFILYATITINNATITYRQIAKNEYLDQFLDANGVWSSNKPNFRTNYCFGTSIESNTKYAATIEKIQRKVFENYDDALWLGWNGTNSPQYDSHRIVCYDGKTIIEKSLTIKNDYLILDFPSGAVDKYLDKGEYTTGVLQAINLPEDTLNALIEKELREAEQE